MHTLPSLGLNHPRSVAALSVLAALVIAFLAVAPTVWPADFSALPEIRVDTDPENMLDPGNPDRVRHRQQKALFNLHDTIVVGVVNPGAEAGVYTPQVLGEVHALISDLKDLQWKEEGKEVGVIPGDIMAPSTVDNIEQAGIGSVRFDWLMPKPPETEDAARAVRKKLENIPMYEGTLSSQTGKALALYIPVTSKKESHDVSMVVKEKIATFESPAEWHITGLPVANDTFGVQMFRQMMISAPMAMLLIFLLMWLFFRKVRLILSPMVLAVLSVMITMGALVISGNTIHIMSSMIPIFIMPIAVLDAVHILSDFFDRYRDTGDRRKTLEHVMDELWRPMLFTSVTTAAGFGSLALTPVPPVQVFGVFISLGVLVAWFLTMTFIPAWIMLIPEKRLAGLGGAFEESDHHGLLERNLQFLARFTYVRAKAILAGVLVVGVLSVWGISLIVINDNPVKWFHEDHPIRVADEALNKRFAGTYPAYLALDARKAETAEPFKSPEVLKWVEKFQTDLQADKRVGKTMALTDLVKTVYRELLGGHDQDFKIPGSSAAVAQTIMTYEGSHRPDDVWRLVTPSFDRGVIWLQLKSGDNAAMSEVVKKARGWIEKNPPPVEMQAEWFGLTYINVVWQEKMVGGMLKAFLSSFAVVLILMALMFRSVLWGALAMVPLTVTIALIYGVIGFVGKPYDMPTAVLSSLSLGLAVDYAIHFLARSRAMRSRFESWRETLPAVFGDPARAIVRNVIVIGIGFLPLLAAPLLPYQTVGILISSILLAAGAATLIILPALLTLLRRPAFNETKGDVS